MAHLFQCHGRKNGYSPSFAYAKAIGRGRSVIDVMDEKRDRGLFDGQMQPHLRIRRRTAA